MNTYYSKNREKMLQQSKDRYADKREEILEKSKQRYENNKGRTRQYYKQYYENNKQYFYLKNLHYRNNMIPIKNRNVVVGNNKIEPKTLVTF